MVESDCFNCHDDMKECGCGEAEGYSKERAICPYCGEPHDPSDDNYDLYDEETCEWDCHECGKPFAVRLHISYSWTTNRLTAHDPYYTDLEK